MATNPEIFDFDIGDVTGPKGDTGNGIKSIQLLSTSGLEKTYRITMTDDTTFDFTVTDGNGIASASLNSTTYQLTLTFDNGQTYTTPPIRGAKGDDGISPAITITTITGGHRVTITDKDHPTGQSFDVMDGASDAGDVTYDSTATYGSGTVGAELTSLTRQLSDLDTDKQDAPATAGTAGQVLGLDSNLNPAWMDQTGGGGGMNIVNLSGTQITQVGADNTFYVCGELTELTFTAPSVGITMIRFTSGTTPTVLTVNGVTSWMYDFDETAPLEANKVYDISVLNGIGVAGWA